MNIPRWLRWRSNTELDEEIEAHLELEIRANLGRGLSPDEARSAALRRFGNVTRVKENAREGDPFSSVEILLRDVRHAARSLLRAPGFTLAALLTLALGIGANAAIYQLFDAVLLRPLPVRDPQRLVIVELSDTSRLPGRRASQPTGYEPLSNPVWERIRDRRDLFDGALAWASTDLRAGQDGADTVARGLFVSGGFFDVLGVNPVLGRTFTAADDQRGCGVPGAVLSHGFWQRRFGGDRSVIGRTLVLDSHAVPIVGVTPSGFSGVEVGRSFDVAVPICSQAALGREEGWLDDGMTVWLTVMARLPAGRQLESVNAALQVASPSIFEATLPPAYPTDDVDDYMRLRLRAVPGGTGVSALRARYGDPLLFLAGVTGLVLLLACTNLANLILARSSAREHEFAVRRALGAAAGRLMRQSMIESALLACGGAVAGLALGAALSRVLVGFLGAELFLNLPVDARLIASVSGFAVLACVTFGTVPAWRASRATAIQAMSDGRSASSTHQGLGLRKALVVSQVAVSLVLVFGAVLFTGTLRNLLAVDVGFEDDAVLVARVDYDALEIPQAARVAFKRNLLDRIESAPGIESAAEVRHVPLGGTGSSVRVWRDGADRAGRQPMRLNAMSEAYLDTMRIPLLAGRDFERQDAGTPVAIVNRAFAARLGLENPVGERFRIEGPEIVFEIVGFIPDSKHFDVREDSLPIAFVPTGLVPDPRSYTDFMIRSTTPAAAVATAVRRAIGEVSPRVRTDIRAFSETIGDRLLPERLMATIAGFFGVLAALIAAVGLYGVVSYLVVRRTSEIGLRMALGATRRGIVAMILEQATGLVAIGFAAGSVLALATAGLAQSLVFGLEPRSIGTIGLACLLLAVVAAGACCLPALRAARMEPRDALRANGG